MATTDITPVVARIANRIQSVTDIGLVWTFDPYDRDDLRPWVMSTIGSVPTLRAWWVSGPTMEAQRATQSSAGHLLRRWTYTIYGVEGLNADGSSMATLRTNALAVTDAIDLDRDLAGTCHRTDPCSWRTIENRNAWLGIAGAMVEITKTVHTLSTP
jgi:hypothetical protein